MEFRLIARIWRHIVADSPTYQHDVSIELRILLLSSHEEAKPSDARNASWDAPNNKFYVSAQLENSSTHLAPSEMLSGEGKLGQVGACRLPRWVIFESDRKWDCGILESTSILWSVNWKTTKAKMAKQKPADMLS